MNTEEHQERIRQEGIETCNWELDALGKQLDRLERQVRFWAAEKERLESP